MKGLRMYLTPFAPDQSGAASVLYEMGGILVICDAGGCTGNVCGFDEPRWTRTRSAIFSAGLRDMDAILGRDDRLVNKLSDAAENLEAGFCAVIGTPVPAVIATDYHALKRMAEKKLNTPVVTIDTSGMEYYDAGEEKAFLTLFKTFAREKYPVDQQKVGILGMTPLDMSDLNAAEKIRRILWQKDQKKAVCYCMGDGLAAVKEASSVEKNLVVSPAALKTARYLKDTFGIPYEVEFPLAKEWIPDRDYNGKRILVIHQQIAADSIKKELLNAGAAGVQTAGWFMQKPECRNEEDHFLREEEDYTELVRTGGFDMIFADSCMEEMAADFAGEFIDLPHFAVSGRLRS